MKLFEQNLSAEEPTATENPTRTFDPDPDPDPDPDLDETQPLNQD